VLNKAYMLAEDERDEVARKIVAELDWKQPWFLVSAIARENTMAVCQQVQRFFESQREANAVRTDLQPGDVRSRGESERPRD
jgi:GTP-binding protein